MSILYQEVSSYRYSFPVLRAPRATIELGGGAIVHITFTHGTGVQFVDKLARALDNYRKFGTPLRALMLISTL